MRHWVAFQVNRRLIEKDSAGQPCRPGGNAARVWKQTDGTDTTLISRGDAFDLYIGRAVVHNVTLSTKTAVSMMWWLLGWWAFSAWFGVKHRLWYWSLGVLIEEPIRESKREIASVGQ